jgi:5-methylcytosine-specific restriction protein A
VDHKQPHHGDDVLMYAWSNLQSLTAECHNRKTATQDGGFGRAPSRPPPGPPRARP